MESTWYAAPLYKGISCAGTRKLGCHRNIFWAAPWILQRGGCQETSSAPSVPRNRFRHRKKSLWHICKIHMHFGKLADPNPRFRLFGAPESRFASVLGQGKGALWIPKPWVRCYLIRTRKTVLWQSNFCASVREVPLYNGAPCHADSILKAFTTFSRMYVSRIIAYLWVPRAQPQVCPLLPFHPS